MLTHNVLLLALVLLKAEKNKQQLEHRLATVLYQLSYQAIAGQPAVLASMVYGRLILFLSLKYFNLLFFLSLSFVVPPDMTKNITRNSWQLHTKEKLIEECTTCIMFLFNMYQNW